MNLTRIVQEKKLQKNTKTLQNILLKMSKHPRPFSLSFVRFSKLSGFFPLFASLSSSINFADVSTFFGELKQDEKGFKFRELLLDSNMSILL